MHRCGTVAVNRAADIEQVALIIGKLDNLMLEDIRRFCNLHKNTCADQQQQYEYTRQNTDFQLYIHNRILIETSNNVSF